MSHTRVSFVLGQLQETTCVRLCQPMAGQTLLVTDLSPCHPQSHLWPDQPGDIGIARWEGGEANIAPCQMGAISPQGELFVDSAIPVKRGTEGWDFVVVHPLGGEHALPHGMSITLIADKERRHLFSLGHSGCHLAALALNRVLQPYWKKEVDERDALGQPDFDRLAITQSRVEPRGSKEQYRIGKSLRKKGVMGPELLAALPEIEGAINQQLAQWVAQGSAITRSRSGEAIIDSRWWHCTLDDKPVTIPCGGTHVESVQHLGAVSVSLAPSDEGFTLHTRVSGI
ncbi:alanyl-tRNA synthetase [Aeromonas sp. RU39B]|uniref:hypothetical protein n=1 Tax=Aeromonas sp. RU39B TaxID=1907416 RepID=UPI0009547109|nr:hypothetical protein [Aeromonas sp. RU39B]SIQ48688.1 alanyl-tRNA synthetase [Aeromonas sp. RU39B]